MSPVEEAPWFWRGVVVPVNPIDEYEDEEYYEDYVEDDDFDGDDDYEEEW